MSRVKQALAVDSLPQVAEALGEPLSTVKTWSARDAVPLVHLSRLARRTGKTIDWFVHGDRSDISTATPADAALKGSDVPPPAYVKRSSPVVIHDPEKLGVAISAVQAGLRFVGCDPTKVNIGAPVQALCEVLPWPLPKAPNGGG